MAVICYHVHQTFMAPEAVERHQFYEEPLIPTVIFDGTDAVFEPDPSPDIYEQHIRAAQSVTPYFNLSMDLTASQTTGSINLKIVTADTIPDDEIIGFITILEDSLRGEIPPFYTFDRICRDMFQFPVDLVYPDSLDTTITFSHSIPTNTMRAVLFIQDLDTKEVMQAIIQKFEEK